MQDMPLSTSRLDCESRNFCILSRSYGKESAFRRFGLQKNSELNRSKRWVIQPEHSFPFNLRRLTFTQVRSDLPLSCRFQISFHQGPQLSFSVEQQISRLRNIYIYITNNKNITIHKILLSFSNSLPKAE